MNDLLERSIKRTLSDIVTATPELGPAPHGGTLPTAHSPSRRPVLVTAAVVAAAGVAGAVVIAQRDAGQSPASAPSTATTSPQTPAAEPLEPIVTLPTTSDLSDAPVTAAVDSPSSWYRVQPDLDVSWHEVDADSTEFCWRTPVDEQCQADADLSSPVVIPTGGGQTLLLLVGGDRAATSLDVPLSDGTLISAPITWTSSDARLGVVRLVVPDGATVAGSGQGTSGDPEAVEVAGATLPPAVGLNETPVTVAAGGPLSYWRFLPDLDISERETARGGTELCYRTPAGTGCIDGSFASPDVGIIPTEGAFIFLVRPGLVAIEPPPSDPAAPRFEQGPTPTEVLVAFADGTTATLDVEYGQDFGLGYARVPAPDGVTIATATSR